MAPINPAKPLPLIAFAQIMSEPLLPTDWLVEGLIARGDRVVVYGEFGSLKSWTLLDLGVHLAAGRPWLGKFAIARPCSVLYVDEEMNERVLRRRIKRLGLGAGLENEDLPLRVLSRAGVTFDEQGAKHLLAALAKSGFDPDVIIVETLRRVLPGDEKEAKDVAAFWRNVEPILRAGVTLVVSHHMRKPRSKSDRANRDRASGSTDILAGADSALALRRLGKDQVAIEQTKSREADEADEFVVSFAAEDPDGPAALRFEGGLATVQGEQAKEPRAKSLTVAFLAAQPERTAKRGAIVDHLGAHSIRPRTADRVIAQLAKAGTLVKLEHGLWRLAEAAGGT